MLQQDSLMFLLESSVDSCSNLWEEYCERFQLIFLLKLISLQHSFISELAQHCAHAPCSQHLSKLVVTSYADRHRYSHGRHENVYATCELAFSSVSPYHRLLQAFVKSLKEMDIAKHNILCLHIVLLATLSNAPNIQSVWGEKNLTITTVPKMLKPHSEVMS
jgi:hypothetical protein